MVNMIKITTKHKTKFLAFLLWLGLFGVARTVMVINDLTFTELADQFVIILRDSWYGPVLFILMYIARPVLLVPGTVLILTAGVVYGFWLGVPLVIIADIMSATFTYAISRGFVNSQPEFEGRAGQFVAFLTRNPFEAILTMQLSYISTDLISSMAGVLHLPLRSLLWAVFIGGSIGNTLGVMVGSTIEGSISNGEITIQPEMVIISFVFLVTTVTISTRIRARHEDS
jgi:uncharacterized membrane protein YdjX (TVP38/TMEM64 family)